MMVLGVPTEVKAFFAKPVRRCAKPIRGSLAAMVLAFLLAPNRRCLKTVAGVVLGHRCHVATISRRLINPQWKTRDWYTKEYCRRHRRKFRTTVQLTAGMLKELRVPDDVDVVVVFDSAFDANTIHRVCRRRGFCEVFPIDPNRVLARTPQQEAAWISGDQVVAWTRRWSRKEFALIELAMDSEDHVFARRRHADNLRVKKTKRRYAVAARRATVSKLGDCLIAASYKENPKVQLLPGQSAGWWAYHKAPVSYRKEDRHQPSRWHGKVLACTDTTATARQVIEWYEVRWQVDLLLMGLLLLEQQRLRDMQRDGDEVGEAWVQARTTDRLRMLEVLCQQWNVDYLEERLRTPGGTRRVLRELRRRAPCQVA